MQKIEEIKTQLEATVAEIKKIEGEFQNVAKAKGQLQEKKSENEMVHSELCLLDGDDAVVYKLVGPILAKQDLEESKSNVKTRINYIEKEILRLDTLEVEFQGKVQDANRNIQKLQNDYRTQIAKMQ